MKEWSYRMKNALLIPIGFLFYVYFLAVYIPFTILIAVTIIFLSFFWPQRHARKLRIFPKAWGWMGVKVPFCPVRVYTPENAKEVPGLIISNHQSLFDIVAALGFYPVDFLFLSKKEVFDIPLIGLAMRKMGYISINRQNPRQAVKSLIEVKKKINENNRVLIYPEGTRSKDANVIQPFKAGAFQVAKEGPFPIIPIVIYGTQKTRPMHSNVLLFPHRISVQCLPMIEPDHELHPASASGLTEKEKLEGLRKIIADAHDNLVQHKGILPGLKST